MSGKLATLTSLAASAVLALATSTAATPPPALPRSPHAAAPGPCRPYGRCDQTIDTSHAAKIVQDYYRALDSRDYRTAYAKWSNNGAASGVNFNTFVRSFAQVRSTSVDIFNISQPDGSTKKQFVTLTVSVDTVLKNGAKQRHTGTYTLRRINDVPDSTLGQRQWHIYSADLRVPRR